MQKKVSIKLHQDHGGDEMRRDACEYPGSCSLDAILGTGLAFGKAERCGSCSKKRGFAVRGRRDRVTRGCVGSKGGLGRRRMRRQA